MFTPKLPDPRTYAHVTPKNSLVLAFHAWSESHPSEKPAAEAHVRFLLEQALAAGEDKLLAVALSLMPSAQAYRTLWIWMAEATWKHPHVKTVPFVMPLVVVAASPQTLTIPGELADVSTLRELWLTRDVFPAESDLWISNRMLAPQSVIEFVPSTLYSWSLLNQPAHLGWPSLPVSAPLKNVQQEGAYLRFVPGMIACGETFEWPKGPGRWARDGSQYLSSLLGASGATALALPRAPQPVLVAIEDGRQAQQEIALQLFLTNALRQFRESGREPAAVLAVHENHELRLCLDDGEKQLVFNRALTALDDLQAIEQNLILLLQECRLDTVHAVEDIQPHLVGGKPYICGIESVAKLQA